MIEYYIVSLVAYLHCRESDWVWLFGGKWARLFGGI